MKKLEKKNKLNDSEAWRSTRVIDTLPVASNSYRWNVTCSGFTETSTPSPPPPPHYQIRMPLELAAELLRAGYVCAAAEVALALIPPLLQSAETSSTVTSSTVTSSTAPPALLVLLQDLLRVLASALAGAAVSSVGGAGRPTEHITPTRKTPTRRGDRAREYDAAQLAGGRGVAKMVEGEQEGEEEGYAWVGRRTRQEKEGVVLLPWSVPSGAVGGALYALTVGGVFGEVVREFFLGEFIFLFFQY